MQRIDPQILTSRLLSAIEMMELGLVIMKQNIARRNPGATMEFLESEMQRWLHEQPDNFFAKTPPIDNE